MVPRDALLGQGQSRRPCALRMTKDDILLFPLAPLVPGKAHVLQDDHATTLLVAPSTLTGRIQRREAVLTEPHRAVSCSCVVYMRVMRTFQDYRPSAVQLGGKKQKVGVRILLLVAAVMPPPTGPFQSKKKVAPCIIIIIIHGFHRSPPLPRSVVLFSSCYGW